MASPRPTAEQLTVAMRDILKEADLASLSSKKVRKCLEAQFGVDLTERKDELDKKLMQLVREVGEEQEGDSDDDEDTPATSTAPNGAKKNKHDDDSSDTSFTKEPPKKKVKKTRAESKPKSSLAKDDSDEDSSDNDFDDESYARKLQREELGVRRRKNAAEKAKKSKKKSEVKDKPSSSRKGTSVYSQPCVLSEELAAVMGQDRMARKDVVSNMWKIFKERQLQDPKNKQYVNCDEQLEKLFKVKKFKAFGMMKILKHHMKDEKLVNS